jgi:prophage maintenance system killer protein
VSNEFSGTHGHPGVIENNYGLITSVQRAQLTVFGKEAYPTFPEKAAAFIFALLQNAPFKSGNRRLALAALLAFCEVNHHTLDARKIDEKGLENLIKKAASHRDHGVPTEVAFREFRETLAKAIV